MNEKKEMIKMIRTVDLAFDVFFGAFVKLRPRFLDVFALPPFLPMLFNNLQK